MLIPPPVPGMVVRYVYLWSDDKAKGRVEGAKERPCVLVLAVRQATGIIQTVVAPITHAPPEDPADSIEVPPAVRLSLGLDSERQWVRLDELNSFGWPGFDLRPDPKTGAVAYGMVAKEFYEEVRVRILDRHRSKKLRSISRDE
jgi:hypothetical protein